MNFFDFSFWQSFVSNALATIIGVGLGILGALWINRLVESRTEKERKRKILTLLKDELGRNHSELLVWSGDSIKDKEKETAIIPAILRVECWKAFSDGGELEWIKDPNLMYSIAEAYYWIRAVMYLSEKHSNLLVNSYMSEEISSYTVKRLYTSLIKIIEGAVLVVEIAGDNIKRHLAKLNYK